MLTLAIDTSTRAGRIAVAAGETVVFAREFISERSHNSQIFEPLRAALEACAGAPELVAVGTGPGSYTGVRIGIAAGIGIAMAHDIPIVGLPSVCAAATGADRYTVVGDARRGSLFVARVADGRLNAEPELVAADAAHQIDGPLYSFDEAAPLPGASLTHPSASKLATLAATFPSDELERLVGVPPEPIYLRAPFITQPKKPGKAVPPA